TTSDANIVLTITGGTGPYTISGLPAGLTPTVTGQRIVITGRAATEGSYSVTVSDHSTPAVTGHIAITVSNNL
ncbi:MAG: hypothetical protein PHH60_00260, partial [Candidatus Margulisbacteria bacterium]|nr:hypothetical protein [Candidatus Margulisiibacteriota bacterium]